MIKKEKKFYIFMDKNNFKPTRLHMQWHITERCNLNCTHCYREEKYIKEENTFEELKTHLENYIRLAKKWGIEKCTISFMGGEVFMREDFFDLLKEAQKHSKILNYSLSINGTMINKEVAKKLKNLGVSNIQISLEGRERVNDSIRGKGVFKKAMRAVEYLKKENIPLNLQATVSKKNIGEIPHMIKLAEKLDVGLGLRRIVPLGSSKKAKEWLLSPKETRDMYLSLMNQEKSSGRNFVGVCEASLIAQEERTHMGCPAGFSAFILMPNGDVYPCRRLPIYAGNLLKESFEDIYYNSKIYKSLRDLREIDKECTCCPYFLECRGGAKCINYGYHEDPFVPDPQCWRLFDKLPSVNKKVEKLKNMEKEKNSKFLVYSKKSYAKKKR